ncbi:polysaccharide deacetylase family protein [Kribbella sp. GL6]|uniref:polysaccharide deacetylase family protein n=1 Tax=Kribbella sp. GL6 TaxID=3419765 RepID=UPI003D06BD91
MGRIFGAGVHAKRATGILLLAVAMASASIPQVASAAGSTVVSLTFNDGLMSQYTYGRPVLQAHNMTGTFYVSSKVIEANAPGYMATWHVDDLYRDGDEIGGLTKDHVDLTDPGTTLAYKQDQVCSDKGRLSALGYDPKSFSYPFAAVDASAEAIVQGCGYLSGRTVGGLYAGRPANALPPADPYWISTPGAAGSPIQLSDLQDAVNVASSNGGGWVPIAFDSVCGASDPNYSSCMSGWHPIDSGVLSAFLDWLQNGAPAGTQVERVRDVMGAPAQPVLPPRPTWASLTFDDGDESQYGVRQILASHNVHGTFFITTGAQDGQEAGAMTWAQIHALANDGNDIGGHTLDHTDMTATGTNYDYKWHEACYDRARLQALGFSPQNFAYPFATFNAEAAGIVQACGYQSGRTGGSLLVGGPLFSETVPPPEPWSYKALGTYDNGPITLQWLQDAVNGAAARSGGWIPIIFHQVCYAGTPGFDTCMSGYRTVSDTTLIQFLDWAAANANRGISVKSISEVLNGTSTVPNVRITAPALGGTVQAPPQITGTAATTGGSVTVDLYAGPYSTGTPIESETATNNNGAWSTTPAGALTVGSTYTVQARQTDSGVTGYSAPITFTIGTDTTPPALRISAPENDSRTNVTTPTISGTGGTAPGDNAAVAVRIYNGTATTGAPVQTLNTTMDELGSFSVTAATLAQGTYTAVASQSDAAGNTGTSTVVFTVDTTPPVVRITSPASGSAVTTTPFTVSGTAGITAGDIAQVTLTVLSGTTTVRTQTAAVAANGTWSSSVAGLPAGTYTLQAGQADTAGNTGHSSNVPVQTRSAMTISSVSPSTAGQGATQRTIDVLGSGFTGATTFSVGGAGVTVLAKNLLSSGWARLTVNVAAAAPTGARDVVAGRTGTLDAVCANCLTVAGAPVPTGASPATVRTGSLLATVGINGSGFNSTSQVSISGNGITIVVSGRSATQISLTLIVSSTATLGARNVTVTNSDGGSGTCTGCLTVTR